MVNNITIACCPARGDESWWIFLTTSAVILVIGLSLSSVSYLFYWQVRKYQNSVDIIIMEKTSEKVFRKYRENIRQFISGDTIPSKILITLTFICNIIYLLIYIYRAYTPFPEGTVDGKCLVSDDAGENTSVIANQIEKCFSLHSSPEFVIELVIVLELIFFAFIRFLAAEDVVHYWLNLFTLVDVFTLPHIFISIILGVDWIGARSLRFIWLPQIINVIQFMPFIRSQDAVDVITLLIQFVSLWLSCTGIIHLVEVQGDFWRSFENAGGTALLSYAYFIMVTFSTVGYGDLSPATASGRAMMILFIILGMAFFAAILPTIVDVASGFYAKRQFSKFDTTRVPRHVIVCGHVTAFSAEEFLIDFLHPDRGDTQTHVLFLHPEHPDPDLKNVIRSHYTRVQYIIGSVLNGKDLQRAKINTSRAVFVVCDKLTNNPLDEDNSNLLRLVSVKNTTTEVPVIIQLLLSTSKKQAHNIEGWKIGHDIALCLNELKLGLLAQSCICPGISTLIANLFYTSDFSALTIFNENDAWKEHYISGASNEIYASHFSHQFEQKTFHEAAEICYNQLGLILISLEKIEGKIRSCYINPSVATNSDLVIESGEEGMLGYFIGQDSEHVSVVATYCERCHGDKNSLERSPKIRPVLRNRCYCDNDIFLNQADLGENKATSECGKRIKLLSQGNLKSIDSEDLEEEFSIYICEPQVLEKTIIIDETSIVTDKLKPDVKDHVVLCIFADETSPLLGLHNFLLPLRSKYISKDTLKPVVIVSNRRFIEREWPLIRKIPGIYVITGSPLCLQNLEQANINECSVCIVLSMLARTEGHEIAINDKESVLCSLSIQEHLKKTARHNILIITDLRQESNVQFLDFGDEDEPDERIYKSQPFACGEAFSVSMFDSVTSSAFHSPGTLHLVEDLIHPSHTRTHSQVIPVPLTDYEGMTFSKLYNDQLKKHTICLGLYRQLPSYSDENVHLTTSYHSMDSSYKVMKPTKHYVITAPLPSLKLEATDIAFLLVEQTDASIEMV